MLDRLRAVECPKEIIDQIGGWSSSDVGESYGDGFPLINQAIGCRKYSYNLHSLISSLLRLLYILKSLSPNRHRYDLFRILLLRKRRLQIQYLYSPQRYHQN